MDGPVRILLDWGCWVGYVLTCFCAAESQGPEEEYYQLPPCENVSQGYRAEEEELGGSFDGGGCCACAIDGYAMPGSR